MEITVDEILLPRGIQINSDKWVDKKDQYWIISCKKEDNRTRVQIRLFLKYIFKCKKKLEIISFW